MHKNFASPLTIEFLDAVKIGTANVVEEQLLLLMKDNMSVESFALMRHLIGSIDLGTAKYHN